MGTDGSELEEAFAVSIRELRRGLDRHCGLVDAMLKDRRGDRTLRSLLDGTCRPKREMRLEQAVREAIDVLEESRRSFKSKRLAALRRKLTEVLIDNGGARGV